MTDLISIAELAAKTRDEIKTRGWTTKMLHDVHTGNVCAVGGCGAAFYGDPTMGYDSDGNGYDTFLTTVADRVNPGWREEMYVYSDGRVSEMSRFTFPWEAVYTWNDNASEAEVIALFDKLANEQEAA